jgi:uncharacterized protein (DUF2235 family)
MKRLVICCDGTWNTPDQTKDGRPCPTNVTKLALAVAEDDGGVAQRLYYHRGVGSYGRPRLRGGAFGVGLSHDVLRAYRFIVDNYEPGDEIFLFGFSRGAFTVRSTAGLLNNAGVLRAENADRIDDAYALYRARAVKPRDIESELFRRSYSHETSAFHTRIRFIGVWDTVGALGIPTIGPKFLTDWVNRRFAFHDTELSSRVDAAAHALAIDEKRRAFKPALWSQRDHADGQSIEQVWFAGVHCDVGGGYPDASLADVTLGWLAGRAQKYGLALRPGAFTEAAGWGVEGATLPAVGPDPFGPAHESRKGLYRLQRRLNRLEEDYRKAAGVSVASTAVLRYDESGACPPGFHGFVDGHPVSETG